MASIFGKFFGNTVSEAAGFAAGVAVSPILHPAVRDLENEANSKHPSRVLDAGTAASIVAEDVEQRDWGASEAIQTGVSGDRFDALLGEALNAPGLSELFETWRRDLIDDTAFTHGLRKAKLEPRWDAPLKALKARLLTLSDLANARQQGFVSTDQQHAESALQGLDAGRADILFELSGLPLGVETMQQAVNRGLVDRLTFEQAVREGHTKTKYTDLAYALRQPVLHATDYAGLYLRGWITEAEMNTGGALTGYTPDQMHLLYLNRGRPAAPGQMATAAARGIDGPKGTPVDRDQFLTAIKQSDIRPEYGPLLWDSRFLYPPLFQITRLVQAGAIDADTAKEWAIKDRYPPEVVAPLHTYWQGLTTGPAANHVTKAQTQLWGTTHRSYIAAEIDDPTALTKLGEAGVAQAERQHVLDTWANERELIRKQLTPAQIKKAVKNGTVNPATGVAWTTDDGLAALIARGYSPNDAQTFLAL